MAGLLEKFAAQNKTQRNANTTLPVDLHMTLTTSMDPLLADMGSESWGTLLQPRPSRQGGGPDQGKMKAYYIKSKFDESKYSVLVTDLTRVWVQSCDRAEIKRLKQV